MSGPDCGGLALFAGSVRDNDGGAAVRGLTYEAHPTALDGLRLLTSRAGARPGIAAVAADHRLGTVAPGELAVVIAVSSPHRAEALEACRWLIDALKQQLPIWKAQHYTDGTTEWTSCP